MGVFPGTLNVTQSLFTPYLPLFYQYHRQVNSGLWASKHTDVSWYFVILLCIELTTGRSIQHIYGQFIPRGILEKLINLSVYLTLNELLLDTVILAFGNG